MDKRPPPKTTKEFTRFKEFLRRLVVVPVAEVPEKRKEHRSTGRSVASEPESLPTPSREQPQVGADMGERDAKKKEDPSAPPPEPLRPIEPAENPPDPPANPHRAVGAGDGRHPPRHPEWIMAWATAGILVATLVNLWVSCNSTSVMQGQLGAMKTANQFTERNAKRALDETKKSNQLTLRSYVLATDIKPLKGRLEEGLVVRVVMKNTGKMPAQDVAIGVRFAYAASQPRPAVRHEADVSSRSLIGPDQTYPGDYPIRKPTQAESELLAGGKGKLYVFGIITYNDFFATDHVTMFCGMYAPTHGGGPLTFIFCPTGNAAY